MIRLTYRYHKVFRFFSSYWGTVCIHFCSVSNAVTFLVLTCACLWNKKNMLCCVMLSMFNLYYTFTYPYFVYCVHVWWKMMLQIWNVWILCVVEKKTFYCNDHTITEFGITDKNSSTAYIILYQGAHGLSKIKVHDISMIFPEPSKKIPGC